MESPAIWNLLTSSIAVCDLEEPRQAWAFLVVGGLVADSGAERDSFLEIVREELKGPLPQRTGLRPAARGYAPARPRTRRSS